MDPLHNIVLSLTRNEKRYLKMFAKAFKSSSQVVRLFEELNKSEEYNEQALVKKTGISNLVATKNSLRKLLFRAMRNYYEDVDIHQQLRDDISNIEFLVRKGLKEEAAKEIRKAIKIAEKGEAYALLSELLVYSALPEKTLKPSEIMAHFDSIMAHHKATIMGQTEVQHAELHKLRLIYFVHHGNYDSPEELDSQVSKISLKMKQIVPDIKSNYARICLLVGLAANHIDADNCLKLYQQIHQIYKQEPHNIQKHPHLYFAFLSNYCAFTVNRRWPKIGVKLFDELETAFITFKDYFKYYPDKLTHFRNIMLGNKLTYCQAVGHWENLDELTVEVKKSLSSRPFRKELLSSLVCASLISCFFTNNKYTETGDWIQTYYSLPSAKMIKPLMMCIRFYECVCFHLLGNYDISEVKSTNLVNTIIEQGLNDDYHKLLCVFLRRLNYWSIPYKSHRNEISDLRHKFEKLRNEEDSYYLMYSGYIKPDVVLDHIIMK